MPNVCITPDQLTMIVGIAALTVIFPITVGYTPGANLKACEISLVPRAFETE
jgi:hypothetical protein